MEEEVVTSRDERQKNENTFRRWVIIFQHLQQKWNRDCSSFINGPLMPDVPMQVPQSFLAFFIMP